MQNLYYKIESELLPVIDKPLRYSGSEHNMIKKDPAGKFKVLLTFPDIYDIGMSYQGYQILYHLLNSMPTVLCERAYLPAKTAFAQFKQLEIPLFGLETRRPAMDFDLIGITISYELNYTNILGLLDLSGIPFYSKDRHDAHPLIIGGGANALNPEPVADFFDLILLGDAEEKLPELIDCLIKSQGLSRRERLVLAEKIGGIYIPAFYTPQYENDSFTGMTTDFSPKIKKNTARLKSCYFPDKPLVPLNEIAQDRLSVEIMRGCTRGCRFCQAGYLYRPVRERSSEDILNQIENSLKATGHTDLSPLSLSSSDYSGINSLIANLFDRYADKNINISFPSMRAESFTPEVAKIASVGKKGAFTFAPEAGSDKMRAVINKQIDMDEITRVLDIILPLGWKSVKLYYMIGLPFETEDDIFEMAVMINNIGKVCSKYGNISVHASISPFNPKPHTPFQWAAQDSLEILKEKIGQLRKFVTRKNVRLDWRNPEVSVLEAIFARGDRRLSQAIVSAYQKGAMLEAWSENFNFNRWIETFAELNIDYKDYIRLHKTDEILPWDHLESGITKEFFIEEWQKAEAVSYTQFCREKCSLCGIQEEFNCKNLLINQDNQPDFSGLIDKLLAPKPELLPLHLRLRGPKFRLKFKRDLTTRFISHRDLLRFLERGIARENIQIAYTEGFHPLPLFSFSHPLSYGYMSDCEYADFGMQHGYSGNIKEDLARLFTDGFELVEVREIERSTPALMKLLNYYEYSLPVDSDKISDFISSLDKFNRAEKIPFVKESKSGKKVEFNLKDFVLDIGFKENNLMLKTRFIDEKTVRTADVLKLVFGCSEDDLNKLFVTRIFAGIIAEDGKISVP